MHRIDHATADDGEFTEGSVPGGIPATVVTADWLNSIQAEIAAFIESRGITLNKATNTQLTGAIADALGSIDSIVSIDNNQTNTPLGELFQFDIDEVIGADIECSLRRKDSTQEKVACGHIYVIGRPAARDFRVISSLFGDDEDLGITFDITTADGVSSLLYNSSNFLGANYEGRMTFNIKKFKNIGD